MLLMVSIIGAFICPYLLYSMAKKLLDKQDAPLELAFLTMFSVAFFLLLVGFD